MRHHLAHRLGAERGRVTAPAHIDTREAWKLQAHCRGHRDPDIWFPDSSSRSAANPAVTVCRECPVTRECGEYAAARRIPYGIWGGKRQAERPGGLHSRKDRAGDLR